MYKLIFEKRALKDLNKLERNIKERIWNKLQLCKLDPFRFLEPLVGIKGFKLRVGDYRIIIDVENEIKILQVLEVGHRKNIYERRY
ncbi:type II toxin-antitoxin system RelE/ParE family toxin [archaeon]|jgi:mRNA interferase RelE/StbE|nr:type II toxin-antitoxin system RelE/ParE family toxin [archaeon]MBT4241855.1 type II toxin-antitoxin system RelE/ParE family toxin [archaeon]MBT4418402.1 type II toxin-antitoxin system RelE/ParE family toxin [archaeon]